jgi:hypothetical protein
MQPNRRSGKELVQHNFASSDPSRLYAKAPPRCGILDILVVRRPGQDSMENDYLVKLDCDVCSHLRSCDQMAQWLSNDALHIDLSMECAHGRYFGFKHTPTRFAPLQ